ncbi:MAG: plasmid stabilization protein [Actinomycetota bacterium]
MSAITIRNVEPELKRKLRIRAAAAGHSMEEEARNILRAELAAQDNEHDDLYQRIRRHIDPLGGVDLPLPDRESMREPPALST